jgi:hypothetical protein
MQTHEAEPYRAEVIEVLRPLAAMLAPERVSFRRGLA